MWFPGRRLLGVLEQYFIHQKLHSESQSWAGAFWVPGQPECEVAGAWGGGPCAEAKGHRQQGQ